VTDRTGMKSVKYGNVSAILLEAFKTLSAENKHLQKQVDELNAHINALQKDNK
jgi:seryl-tRNA synthetase